MNQIVDNVSPVPAPGHNRPPFAEVYADLNTDLQTFLETEHAGVLVRTQELLDAAATAPAVLDASSAPTVTDMIAQITAHVKSSDAIRVALNAPVLKAQRQINGFFAANCEDKLDTPKSQVGIKQQLLSRLTVWENHIAAEERKRREAAERAAREAAEAAERVAAEERRKAAEAEAAERARAEAAAQAIKNETDMAKALELEEANRAAQAEREAQARAAAAQAEERRVAAEEAARAASAKAAEMSTVRGDYGSSSSLRTMWTATIEDLAKVDLNLIRDFIGEDAVQKALNAWVKINKDKKPVPGVKFHQVTGAVVRG